MYTFYRTLPGGKWKFTKSIKSTLDKDFEKLKQYCESEKIDWALVQDSNKIVVFSNKVKLERKVLEL